MAITISDIADKVGVTKATVSLVLNKNRSKVRISKDTRRKILDVARELNYVPSFSAQALARGKTYTLGFVVGDIQAPHFAELSSFAMEEAESRGYHLLLSVTKWSYEKELECLDMLLCHRVDGIVFGSMALQPGTRQFETIQAQRYPVVLFGSPDPNFASVHSDWNPGMSQAVEYLEGKGCRRLAYVFDPAVMPAADLKKNALTLLCEKKGIALECFGCLPTITDARRVGEELAVRPDRPKVVLVQSDYLATGFMRGLHDKGLAIPRDVAVMGCDGTQMGEYYLPPLTSIAQDCRSIITNALDLLLELVENKDAPRRHIRVPTRLIVRSSA
jgi:LacI family transcriptional regulator